ncbi:MAG: sulfurtransferase TusA family protein [Nitrospinota bacterium]|nr:sulfurtransferase TusA family protein [Nitrospinota bacterium]
MAMTFEKKGDGLYELNVQGFVCPHPQLYTKKSLEKVNPGDVINVIFDNPSSGESIASMCESQGNEIIEKKEEGGKLIWSIKKSED